MKLELVKRDFVWIGLIVVLLIVGFGYAYGGSAPAVMGHSSGEIQEADPTVLASVKNGVSWAEVSGKPAGFADNVDDTISGLSVYTKTCSGSCTASCNSGDVRTGCSYHASGGAHNNDADYVLPVSTTGCACTLYAGSGTCYAICLNV